MYKDIRKTTAEILKFMAIPLIQQLIFHMEALNEHGIELYTVAVIPLSVACAESIYETLAEHLQSTDDFQSSDIDDEFTEAFKSFLQCYRITCDDLVDGMNPTDQLKTLVDRLCYNDSDAERKKLAGFAPTTDVSEVRSYWSSK
jgi:hypothetical protein